MTDTDKYAAAIALAQRHNTSKENPWPLSKNASPINASADTRADSHAALDRGTHIALERCCEHGCTCPQFRRVVAGSSRPDKRNHRAHGVYIKSGFRI